MLHPIILDVINGVLADLNLPAMQRKKTTTHSGEWFGMCPRCYTLYGDGGRDRFLCWPNDAERPVEGYPGSKPCFWCRRCKREDGSDWSGDLVQFCQDIMGLPYHQARKFLQLPPKKAQEETVYLPLAPTVHRKRPPLPPANPWQDVGWHVMYESERTLWLPDGAGARDYLYSRGFTDELIRQMRLGYTGHEDQYILASEWGLSGAEIRVSSGIVIPEIHKNLVTGEDDLWALIIRRSDEDVEYDFLLTGKYEKYHFVRGSERGLFLDWTLELGKPCFIVEGQFDAYSIYQEASDLVSVVATGGKQGARHFQFAQQLNLFSPLKILVPDIGDKETSDMTAYWMQELDHCFIEKPLAHDVNDMLKQGNGHVREWVLGILKKYQKLGFSVDFGGGKEQNHILTPSLDIPPQNRKFEPVLGIVTEPVKETKKKKSSVYLDPLTEEMLKSKKAGFSLKSSPFQQQSDAEHQEEIIAPQKGKNEAVLSVSCRACQQEGKYTDDLGNRWCTKHLNALHLMNNGEKAFWQELYVPEGYGLVDPLQHTWTLALVEGGDPGPGWKYSAGCRVPEGRIGYLSFCEQATPEELWLAARYARDVGQGWIVKEQVQVKKRFAHPCANCGRDADKAVFLFPPPPTRWEGQEIKVTYVDKPYDGFVTWQGTPDELRWCARCIPCHNFLKEMEVYGFPGMEYGSVNVPSGKQAAIEYVLDKQERTPQEQTVHVNYALDTFKFFYMPQVLEELYQEGEA